MFYHRTVWGQNGPEVVLKNLTEDIFPFFHSQVLTTKSPHRTIVKVHLEPVLCTSSPVAGHQEDATTGDFDDDDDDINNQERCPKKIMKIMLVVFAHTTQRFPDNVDDNAYADDE